MSEYIPFEIQTEIIKRLPAKSAVKFRLVSKPWNSYIGSSDFIIAHHRRNIHHQPPRLLAWCKNPSDVDIYVTLFDDDDSFYRQDFTPKSQGLSKVLMDLKVVDCSLGLVCLYGSHYHDPSTSVAILWNPLIKKSVQVVLPPSTTASATRVLAGFGVCPVTFDPTVVSISLPWKAQVFTLTSGTWRSLMSSNLSRRNINLPSAGVGSQVVIDKFIYLNAREWRFVDKVAKPQNVNLIVSFDMTTHEFDVIQLPDTLSHANFLKFSKMRDSIVVVEFMSVNMEINVVWVMEDIVTKSFSKRYAIKAPNPTTKDVLGFRNSGESIMEAQYHGEGTLEVYEPCSEHISKLGINGKPFSFFVSPYVETLLLLDQADCHIHADSD